MTGPRREHEGGVIDEVMRCYLYLCLFRSSASCHSPWRERCCRWEPPGGLLERRTRPARGARPLRGERVSPFIFIHCMQKPTCTGCSGIVCQRHWSNLFLHLHFNGIQKQSRSALTRLSLLLLGRVLLLAAGGGRRQAGL